VLLESGSGGVEIVADAARVSVVEERADHWRAEPELIGMQPQFVDECEKCGHGSNGS